MGIILRGRVLVEQGQGEEGIAQMRQGLVAYRIYTGSSTMVTRLQKEVVVMECIYCKGRMQRTTAPFSIDRKGYHICWDAIPAWVCTQCGEPYFESREVDLIQKVLSVLDRENIALTGVEGSPNVG